MAKRLIVAEKPSVGREIAKVLGCRERVAGAIRGEGDIVTWAVGHLVEQCYPEDMDDRYKEWKKRKICRSFRIRSSLRCIKAARNSSA